MPVSDKPVVIHPTAVVSPRAQLDAGVVIGPYSVVGPYAKLGRNCRLHSHVVVDGHVTAGVDNEFFPFCSVGSRPQDLKYKGEPSELVLGDGNSVREYVTLSRGTEGGGMLTRIGNKNLFMANSHVGHDSVVGDSNVIANGVALAGHVTIQNRVVLGGLTAVHQFCRIGNFAMAAGGAMITKDAPPFSILQGDRAELYGVNVIGLQRGGVGPEEIRAVRSAYRKLFFAERGTPFAQRLEAVRQEFGQVAQVRELLEFIGTSQRGVIFAPSRGATDESGARA